MYIKLKVHVSKPYIVGYKVYIYVINSTQFG